MRPTHAADDRLGHAATARRHGDYHQESAYCKAGCTLILAHFEIFGVTMCENTPIQEGCYNAGVPASRHGAGPVPAGRTE